MWVWIQGKILHRLFLLFFFFFFFAFTRLRDRQNLLFIRQKTLFTHCSYTVYVLFTGPTTLFTHLKIILLQFFQFPVSATISSIQTDPKYHFFFLNVMHSSLSYTHSTYGKNFIAQGMKVNEVQKLLALLLSSLCIFFSLAYLGINACCMHEV